jgi:hypothetical protein
MTIAVIAAVFCVFANFFIALFQFGLAAGAPMGQYAWGGRFEGILPTRFRLASGVSGFVLLAVSGHYASILGWLPSLLDAHGRAFSLWALTVFYALSFLGNLRSKSQAESKMFVPVTGALVLANVLILVFYRLG